MGLACPFTAGLVATDPSNVAINTGGTATFTAVSSNAADTVQWQVSTDTTNFTDIPGATSNTLSFTVSGAQNGYQYRAVFSGTLVTSAATLTVDHVTTNPSNTSVADGQTATFTAASFTASDTVQWQVSTNEGVSTNGGPSFSSLSNGGVYGGVTTGTLTITGATIALNNREYRAVFSNASSSFASSAATLQVVPGHADLSQSTVSVSPLSIAAGSTATVTLTAKDAYGYRETSGGLNIVFGLGGGSGGGSFSGVTDNNDGTYTAIFTGTAVESNMITATINGQAVTSTQPTITIVPPVITFSPANLPAAIARAVYNQGLTGNGGTAPYSNFIITSGALPAGLSLSTAGIISGTPTAVGTVSFTVTAQDSTTGPASPYTGSQSYTLTVSTPVITFSPANLLAATAGAAYSQALSGNGGTSPYSKFTITSGALPAGLSLSTAGTISGTPTAVGTFNFTIKAQDSTTGSAAPYTGSQSYTLTVSAPVITFSPANLPAATAIAAYSQSLAGKGGTAPYAKFTIIAGALPAGLSLSASGTISGTPTVAGSFSFIVKAQDSTGGAAAPYTGSQSFTLTVKAPVITFSPASLPAATAGATYSKGLTGNGGTAPYSNFTINSGALPAGLSLSSAGIISGTPTAVGTFGFTVTAHDLTAGPAAPYTGSQSYALTVSAPVITFNPANLPAATAGAAYSHALSGNGGTTPYSQFTLTSGALPAGLSLSSAGTIGGTPTAVGTFSFTVTAQDSTTGPAAPYTGSQSYTLTVSAPAITFSPASLLAASAGAAYSQALSGDGGTTPYSQFTITSGALPAGLSLSTAGLRSAAGTPTAVGTFSFTVTAQDSTTGPAAPYSGSQAYTLTVAAPVITFSPANLPAATAIAAYSQTLAGKGGTAPYSKFKITAGALPAGLSLSASGTISGTPTVAGSFSFTVMAQDATSGPAAPYTGSQSFTLTVKAPVITFTPGNLPAGTAGAAYSQALAGNGGSAPYSKFTITSGALPAGLSLSSAGTISGTPTAVGAFGFTVNAQDSTAGPAAPYTGSQNYTLAVKAPVFTFSPANLLAATAGAAYSQALAGNGGTAPYSQFTITSGALPNGLSLSSAGTISGTPTAVGSFSFTVKAHDSTTGAAAPYAGSQNYTLIVNAPVIMFSPANPPAATAGAPYSQALGGDGGTAPYSKFTITSGALPAGLSLSSAGTIGGTPTAAGTFHFTVMAQDSSTGPAAPYTGSQSYTLTVNTPVITLSPANLPAATAGAAFSQALTGTGGTAPYSSFMIASGTLPAGLSLSATGAISGTATAVGTFDFTVKAQDSTTGAAAPYTGSQDYTLTVKAPVITFGPAIPPAATAGVAYSQALTGKGGTAPYSKFSIASGALPAGLSLSSDGAISGTATAAGTFTFAVKAQDSTTGAAAPYTGTQVYSLTVNVPVITFSPASLPAAAAGAAYSGRRSPALAAPLPTRSSRSAPARCRPACR